MFRVTRETCVYNPIFPPLLCNVVRSCVSWTNITILWDMALWNERRNRAQRRRIVSNREATQVVKRRFVEENTSFGFPAAGRLYTDASKQLLSGMRAQISNTYEFAHRSATTATVAGGSATPLRSIWSWTFVWSWELKAVIRLHDAWWYDIDW